MQYRISLLSTRCTNVISLSLTKTFLPVFNGLLMQLADLRAQNNYSYYFVELLKEKNKGRCLIQILDNTRLRRHRCVSVNRGHCAQQPGCCNAVKEHKVTIGQIGRKRQKTDRRKERTKNHRLKDEKEQMNMEDVDEILIRCNYCSYDDIVLLYSYRY